MRSLKSSEEGNTKDYYLFFFLELSCCCCDDTAPVCFLFRPLDYLVCRVALSLNVTAAWMSSFVHVVLNFDWVPAEELSLGGSSLKYSLTTSLFLKPTPASIPETRCPLNLDVIARQTFCEEEILQEEVFLLCGTLPRVEQP